MMMEIVHEVINEFSSECGVVLDYNSLVCNTNDLRDKTQALTSVYETVDVIPAFCVKCSMITFTLIGNCQDKITDYLMLMLETMFLKSLYQVMDDKQELLRDISDIEALMMEERVSTNIDCKTYERTLTES